MGADCNRSENDGWTALHFAASGGYDEIVEILLKVSLQTTFIFILTVAYSVKSILLYLLTYYSAVLSSMYV